MNARVGQHLQRGLGARRHLGFQPQAGREQEWVRAGDHHRILAASCDSLTPSPFRKIVTHTTFTRPRSGSQ